MASPTQPKPKAAQPPVHSIIVWPRSWPLSQGPCPQIRKTNEVLQLLEQPANATRVLFPYSPPELLVAWTLELFSHLAACISMFSGLLHRQSLEPLKKIHSQPETN